MLKSKILVADDSPEFRIFVRDILKSLADCEVIMARNGRECLQQFEVHRPRLVITDTNMPEVSGIEVLKALRLIDRQVPIILLFSYFNNDPSMTSSDVLAFGASMVIEKKDLYNKLVASVQALLAADD
jgi:two-component system response regulator (stage 0 sporulation protein F)